MVLIVVPDCKSGLGDLSQQSPKDKPWELHRSQADSLQVLLATSPLDPKHFAPEDYALRMVKCAQALKFGISDTGTERVFKLETAHFCRVPVCPICTWRRSMKWRARLIQGLEKLVRVYPDHEYLFLTLTIRNCPIESLRVKIGQMVKGWHNLCHKKEFPAVGYVRSLEVTRNPETGECHPHLHCLLMVRKTYFKNGYLSQARWTELWQQCMHLDYVPIVNVKKVRRRKRLKAVKQVDPLEGQGTVDTDISAGLINAILETAKYCVKPSDLLADPDWIVQVADQLYGLRKTVTGGLIRQFVNDTEDDGDLVHITETNEDIPEYDYHLVFDWWFDCQKYLQRINP